MLLTLLKSKLHRAQVTQSDLHYEGSITIDRDLMDAADILPFEQVDVLNINNGTRFTTYAIEGARGSGIIGINGAAARLAQVGDLIIICTYAGVDAQAASSHEPVVILLDDHNRIKSAD
ncbi:MAG: aspartate 1-decarboxylase [Alphaproteobacteria bacterium]|nr:aspartate 1-decarboxylase [Alphaproteobacteria bacterium]